MRNRKTIIFDFDGTIADSAAVFVEIAHKISGKNAKIEAREMKSVRGLIRFGQRANMTYWRMPRALAKVRGMVDENIDRIKPFDSMADVIEELHNSGSQLFIVSTNARPTIIKFLRQHQLDQYFSGVYGSNKLVKSKTKSLKTLLKKRGLSGSDCIFVGDESRDLEAANSSGMPCIVVAWGFGDTNYLRKLAPAALAYKPNDLPSIITNL